MGMYTELNIEIEVVNDKKVINILKYMLGDIEDKPKLFDHELFTSERWEWMLRSDSYYFDGQTDSKLFTDNLSKGNQRYYLNVRCNLKNYDKEIQKFLDWLYPYMETYGFIGYSRYEECYEPTLIYNTENGIEYK